MSIQSVRGMRDILLPESAQYAQLLKAIEKVLHQYGYEPIQLPLLEKTALFKRTIGEETDVVSKEMYTFVDRNDESLTLRPEATAGVVRAMIENGLLQQVNRVYTAGAMFRYERPQKGRYRQFSQVSVEAFGVEDAALDVELLAMNARLFRELGVSLEVKLEINSIGTLSERRAYTKDLVAYLSDYKTQLDEDSQRRLTTNPLRILDSKDTNVQKILEDAPRLSDYLGAQSQAHFAKVCALLSDLGIEYVINTRLVRGLDYYCHTVFEWTTDKLGAQGTVCAGGRYDGLVEQLGGKPTPAAGFAIGLDRLLLLVLACSDVLALEPPWVYAISASETEQSAMFSVLEALRSQFPHKNICLHAQPQSLKTQIKKADKSGAKFALILGEAENNHAEITVKHLYAGQQETIKQAQLAAYLQSYEQGESEHG